MKPDKYFRNFSVVSITVGILLLVWFAAWGENQSSGRIIDGVEFPALRGPKSVPVPDYFITYYPESRNPEYLKNQILLHTGGLSFIYSRHAKMDAFLIGGTIKAEIEVAASGEVLAVNLEADHSISLTLESELKNRIKSWKFDPVKKGDVLVTVPFTFVR
jgi:hypothetical protein